MKRHHLRPREVGRSTFIRLDVALWWLLQMQPRL